MESNLAVLIDFENIAAGAEKEGPGRFDVAALLERIKDKGRVLLARSYADWGRFARYKQNLLTNNVTMIELTSHGMQNKNRADIAMVVDALELAFTRDYIDTYIVASGDSDFTPMVLKMRELNKRVIGVGLRQSTSRLLIQACDEFIFYDTIVRSKRRSEQRRERTRKTAPGREEAFDLLVETMEGLQRENVESPLASIVKSAMLRKSPDFSESDYGYSSFARFLEAAQRAGAIRVARDQKAGGYRVTDVVHDSSDDEEDEGRKGGRARPKDKARGRGAGQEPWTDPRLPDGAGDVLSRLRRDGLDPLSSNTRMAILDAVRETVSDRSKRNRRVAVQYVEEDVRKRLKRSNPDIPARAVKAVLAALMNAGVLIHPDGKPVRSTQAPFTLDKDSEEMNRALVDVYLEALQETDEDLADMQVLTELFFGDASERDSEDRAWLSARLSDEDDDTDEHEAAVDLDDLLEVDEAVSEGDDLDADDLLEVEEPGDE